MASGLTVEWLSKRFGGLQAVADVSFSVEPGTILGLIGPNGSGKTTTLNLLNGVVKPDGGRVAIDGHDLTGRSSREVVAHGVTRTFQNPRVFLTVTALENLLVPTLHEKAGRRQAGHKALELLDFVGLAAHADTPASELSGGQQKLLEFVRALVTDPAVVLMDEPFAGVHPSLKDLMRSRIRERNETGTSFVIVSHEIPDLMRLSDSVICMSEGRLVSQGPPEQITADPRVIEAYLGHAGRGAA